MRILVVEDEPTLCEQVAAGVREAGYAVDVAHNGLDAHFMGDTEPFDAVVLDLGLPQMDGLTVLKKWRAAGRTMPVLILTARDRWSDKVQGFDAGADDYVAKPFDPRELLARIESVMRRMQSRPVADEPAAPRQTVQFGRCSLDLASHQLTGPDGVEIPITSMEFDLLKVFAENPGKALSRDRILTLTKNREWDPYDRSIDIRVARLRRKLEADPDAPHVIRTVRGVGYMFVSDA